MIIWLRKKLGLLIVALVRARHGVVIFYGEEERARIIDLVAQVRRETRPLLSDHEAYQIHMAVQKTAKVPGDIAEVGTYRGASAKIIAEARGPRSPKTIHLFDTFEGLPSLSDIDSNLFYEGQYPASLEEVQAYLKGHPLVQFYKGVFPQTAGPVEKVCFSFVHLDADIYESTKACLEFFYPRLSRGGVLISHDYINSPGVRKAVDEFMADKPEPVLESSWRQCIIVKT